MRAKRVNEDINFERGGEPKEKMDIGIPRPSKRQVLDVLTKEETFEKMDFFINDLIDEVYQEYVRAKPDDVIDSIGTIVAEILDNWYQTTEAE